MTVQQLGVGIVGGGTMGSKYASVVDEDDRVALRGWVSRSTMGERDGVPIHATIDDLLEDDTIGIVIVATPDFAHRDPAVAAARAGRHVLIEKPLAMSGPEAAEILAATRSSGVAGMTLYSQRWTPAYWLARQELDDAEAGHPVMAYARKNDTLFVATDMISWADKSSPSWFLSSHDVDMISWLIGEPIVEVYATAVRGILTGMGIDTPDAVQAQARFESGAVATFESSWTVPNGYPTVVESFVEVIMSDRHIHIDRKTEQLEIASSSGMRFPRTGSATIAGREIGPPAFAVRHFFDVVMDGVEQLIPLSHSVGVTYVLEAIEESYDTGLPVTLTSEARELLRRSGRSLLARPEQGDSS